MTIKKSIFSLVLIILCSSIYAEIPQGYYNSINGKKNSALKTALSRILVEHTVLSYNSMWYYWKRMDARPDGSVWDMYSNIIRYFNSNDYGVSGMNREHSFPKSWWAVSGQVDQYDAYSDLNHLNPSDANANDAKSNYVLGETGKSVSFNNGVSKVGPNVYQGAPSTICFEPSDEYKGDFARAYMYIVTCYENYALQWRSEALQMLRNETYPVFQNWSKEMLLKWTRNDKVSQKETDRNEWTYIFQGNRNPFIDFPQLTEYIWGDSVDYAFKVPENLIAKDPVLVTPAQGTIIHFGEIKPGTNSVRTIQIKGENLKGNLSISVYGANASSFKLPATTIPSQLANSETGYDLPITYTPTETGEHEAGFVIYDGGIAGSIAVSLLGICSETASIIPVGADFPDLYVDNGEIVFRAYQPGTKVYLYNILGRLIYTDICTGVWQNYTTTQPGIYLININGTTKKILVK
ncbi:MAG: endonuclease [Candidatus Azobacteroides sp.]|nr:endonuclease [Candidatus Azobacteroides sp.]